MKFLAFIELRLRHTYYTDARCPDFEIEPTPDTHQLLKNYRCVFKALPDGLRILIATTKNNGKFVPLIPLQTGLNFSFYLRLQNPDFPLFTDIAKTQPNNDEGTAGQLDLISCPSKTLRYDIPAANIELNGAPLNIANGPSKFEIQFQAKQAKWKYYLITDNASNKFSIEDKDDSSLVFGLNRAGGLDSIAQMLAGQYPNMQLSYLISNNLIACQQQARKSIQLNLNGHTVLEHLPNPSLRNYATNEKQEEVLFQVIKYLTH